MNNNLNFKNIISKLSKQETLHSYELDLAFTTLLNGTATNAQIGAFLMGLSINGETSDIIASGATILRNNAIKIKAPAKAIDTVGTGEFQPIGDQGLMQGGIVWEVDGGSGIFERAKGIITSNFTLDKDNRVTDYHHGVIFVP